MLDTVPPTVDGVLTSCGAARLMCSHDSVAEENTRWKIILMNGSVYCQETIDHLRPNLAEPCGALMFEDITELPSSASLLSSTATVDSLPLELSGSQVSCIAGTRSTSPVVGNVTLCVIGEQVY